MNPTLRTWLLGLSTAVLLAAVQALLNYLTGNPIDAASSGVAAGVGFAAGRMATLRVA